MKKNLKKESLIRYSRQIVLKNIGIIGQKKIINSKVLIVGIGGLGCPIADLLTRIRNAQGAGHAVVSIPASRVKIAVVHLLKQEGYVRAYRCIRDNKQGIIKVSLKYKTSENRVKAPVINSLYRVSKPGCRRYLSASKVYA